MVHAGLGESAGPGEQATEQPAVVFEETAVDHDGVDLVALGLEERLLIATPMPESILS